VLDTRPDELTRLRALDAFRQDSLCGVDASVDGNDPVLAAALRASGGARSATLARDLTGGPARRGLQAMQRSRNCVARGAQAAPSIARLRPAGRAIRWHWDLVILGMGSSAAATPRLVDVDLVIVYPDDGDRRRARVLATAFFERVGRKVISALNDIAGRLRVQVDMRLRPYGEAALRRLISALEQCVARAGVGAYARSRRALMDRASTSSTRW
jgi:hypothetical protein